ncbi:MAG: SRPBCC family protein [Caldilineaceae bacterium]
MTQYKQSIRIPASPDSVFDFVADVRNLPLYLPTLHKAQRQSNEQVRVQDEAEGQPYAAEGFLHVDRANYRLEWGANEHGYSGHLKIQPQDDQSLVTVHIHWDRKISAGVERFSDDEIQQSLVDALETLRNAITGEGELTEEDLTFPDGQSNDLSPSVVA